MARGVTLLGVFVVVVYSHIQRIVLATEETTPTQRVSHRLDLSNANNPAACGHKEVQRSKGHIMVTTFFPHNRGMLRRSKCVLIFL